MSLPIEATPILEGEDAEKFFAKIKEDLKTPTSLIPTPKLEQAKKIIKEKRDKISG
jgi:hypothetical protein